jgi:hypothetical protein
MLDAIAMRENPFLEDSSLVELFMIAYRRAGSSDGGADAYLEAESERCR